MIIYFSMYVIIDVFLYLHALSVFRFGRTRKQSIEVQPGSKKPKVSIIVPAYNEEVSIVTCVKMLLKLNYENYQLIVVNDGSRDSTLDQMFSNFDFVNATNSDERSEWISTARLKQIYVAESGKLLLIDKENGGKADAINMAINVAEGEYICTIDADSILDPKALEHILQPFLEDDSVFVSGGQIALSNDLLIENNRVVSAKMPRKWIVLWQILEYISTFMVARISMSRINALIIMSGAFSMFRKADLMAVGGFLTKINDHPYILKTLGHGKQVLTEDMEIVLRLWKYLKNNKKKARAVFLPGPVCWTEAPEKFDQLYKQRSRWHQGLAETLWLYRQMIFEPAYGIIGMLAIPYNFFMELLSPIVKLLAIPVLILMMLRLDMNQQWVVYFIAGVIVLYTIIMSTITVMIEQWSMKQTSANRDALRYKGINDWIMLLFSGIIANFTYSFFKMFAQINGILNFFRKKHNWMKFDRKGIQTMK